jgi:DNA-binding response OmpR family regulator
MTVERPLDGKLILIVEDDYFQADDARRALEAAGAKVLGPFADEIAGVKALHTGSPHCAVLDINLGLGPSLEIARSASALGAPIVFMTGYDEQQIAPEFIRVERLQKPVNAHDLVAAWRRSVSHSAGPVDAVIAFTSGQQPTRVGLGQNSTRLSPTSAKDDLSRLWHAPSWSG